jgi:hypothetical protein
VGEEEKEEGEEEGRWAEAERVGEEGRKFGEECKRVPLSHSLAEEERKHACC